MRKTPKKTKKTKSSAPVGKQRLQKILAASGIDSRRKCEILILEHAVSVNGEIVNELPAFADPEKDDIRVDGQRIKQTKKVYTTTFANPEHLKMCANIANTHTFFRCLYS